MSREIALNNVLTPAAIDEELAGFTFVASDGAPFITLDTQRRFYFNASLRKMFGLRAYSKVAIGYQPETRSIAILTKNLDRVPHNYAYILDKRHYASARKFVKDFRINVERGALTYLFDRGTSTDGVYIFRLQAVGGAPVVDVGEVVTEVSTLPEPSLFPSVELTEGSRIKFNDIMDVDVYVSYDGRSRKLSVSTEHRPQATKVYVSKDGLSAPTDAIANAYAKNRPVTLELAETTEDGVRIYRKAK